MFLWHSRNIAGILGIFYAEEANSAGIESIRLAEYDRFLATSWNKLTLTPSLEKTLGSFLQFDAILISRLIYNFLHSRVVSVLCYLLCCCCCECSPPMRRTLRLSDGIWRYKVKIFCANCGSFQVSLPLSI